MCFIKVVSMVVTIRMLNDPSHGDALGGDSTLYGQQTTASDTSKNVKQPRRQLYALLYRIILSEAMQPEQEQLSIRNTGLLTLQFCSYFIFIKICNIRPGVRQGLG